MPDAKFILKEPNSNDKSLVYLFYNYNNLRLKYSTGEKILPANWNSTKQRAKETAKFPEYPEFNQRLRNIETAINTCYRRLLNDERYITSDLLREELNIELNKEKLTKKRLDLLEWIKNEIEILKLSQKVGSIQVYNALLKHLTEFSITRRFKLNFENVTIEFYEQFQDYLINEKKLLNNTFGKQIKTLKTFLNLATEKGINTNLAYKSRLFKAPQETIDHIFLNDEELDKIHKTDFGEKLYLDRVRDQFLIGCHTGLRFSDFTQLKKENYRETNYGSVFNVITYKTDERVIIPIKPIVKGIWDKYNGNLPRPISNQKMNEYLKEIGQIAGISNMEIVKKKSGLDVRQTIQPKHELISTHTARRSFATNAFLSGIPAISIMKFTGHKTESSFMKYIKVTQSINAELLSNHKFFN